MDGENAVEEGGWQAEFLPKSKIVLRAEIHLAVPARKDKATPRGVALHIFGIGKPDPLPGDEIT
jgi:hypothetical protein